jgi:hypothetical protein
MVSRQASANAGEWLRAKVLGSRARQLGETDDIAGSGHGRISGGMQ